MSSLLKNVSTLSREPSVYCVLISDVKLINTFLFGFVFVAAFRILLEVQNLDSSIQEENKEAEDLLEKVSGEQSHSLHRSTDH